ncbi:MAG: hypothetical protein QUS14_13035 [Pyrinomonadaceae bacterium]|nr:hypothetical protein [Pyrinomonadaceae bacterium]
MQQQRREQVDQEFPGHDDNQTGLGLPDADGQVSDDDVQGFSRPDQRHDDTGQDNSTENYEETEPDEGVGAIQDRSDTTSDVARTEP